MHFSDWKIARKLMFLSGLLLALMLLLSAHDWWNLYRNQQGAEAAMQQAQLERQAVDQARKAQVEFKIQIQEWKNTLLRGNDQAAFDKYSKEFVKMGGEVQKSLDALQQTLKQLDLKTDDVVNTQKALSGLTSQYMEALKSYDVQQADSAKIVDAKVKGMDRAPTKQIDGIVESVQRDAKERADQQILQMKTAFQQTIFLSLTLAILGVMGMVMLTFWISRAITGPLSHAVEVAHEVAAGNLDVSIRSGSRDEAGQLLGALKEMTTSLVSIVREVRNGTENISTASSEMAAGNLDLSSRTEQQAGSLEETAAAMEELTSNVKQNLDNTEQALTLAGQASSVAEKGGVVVKEVINTMRDIHSASAKIEDIISVIDGIAFQTNILALNAAVEAARAGEQGRGFAVVASEVRSLAQRSAGAAKEIKVLIRDSVDRVNAGTGLVDQAGATMLDVVSSVSNLATVIHEIANANREQTSGIEQINRAIMQMDQVTQQNAALVEEAAAAAGAMQHQAGVLGQMVAKFRVHQQGIALQLASSANVRPALG